MSVYTVFIPRVFSNISQERISNVFHDLNIGSVEHVDLVPKTSANGKSYNMAFVHFAMIYNTNEATKFRQEVEDPEKKAVLQYDGPWFWLVLPFEQKNTEKDTTDEEEYCGLPFSIKRDGCFTRFTSVIFCRKSQL